MGGGTRCVCGGRCVGRAAGSALSSASSRPPPLQRAPRAGFPGRRAAQWRLRSAAAFIAVRQTGRNSHFPPGCSPPPAGPGAHFNPLRASGARPGRPSCLLTAAWPGSSQQGGRLPGRSSGWCDLCPDRAASGRGSQRKPSLGPADSASRGAWSLALPSMEPGLCEASSLVAPFYRWEG